MEHASHVRALTRTPSIHHARHVEPWRCLNPTASSATRTTSTTNRIPRILCGVSATRCTILKTTPMPCAPSNPLDVPDPAYTSSWPSPLTRVRAAFAPEISGSPGPMLCLPLARPMPLHTAPVRPIPLCFSTLQQPVSWALSTRIPRYSHPCPLATSQSSLQRRPFTSPPRAHHRTTSCNLRLLPLHLRWGCGHCRSRNTSTTTLHGHTQGQKQGRAKPIPNHEGT